MLFNTLSYLVFLLVAVLAYWVLRPAYRSWLILAASLLFYALWRVEFVLLIGFSAFVDYVLALKIHGETRIGRRKLWLVASLTTNLLLLAYFKYAYFALGNLAGAGSLLGQDWRFDPGTIILPLGISFYTFLSISYTVDVHRGFFIPVRSFATYLNYVMFWPHVIAGPILRAHDLVPQLVRNMRFDSDVFVEGVRKILFGLFLKVGLADQIAPYVNEAFLAKPAALSALDVWTMAFALGLQIYFDFAGYSMIAIGSALLLGIRFPENFNWPYLAQSPRDFWRRWHITLSSWVRDYLYLPLSGVRPRDKSTGGLEVHVLKPDSWRLTLALFLTWFLMGLWHGPAWTFALWGIWHATAVWLYRWVEPQLGPLPDTVRTVGGWGLTLGIGMLAWIPFRARSVEDALALLARILDVRAYGYLSLESNFYLITAVVFLGMLMVYYSSRLLTRLRSSFANSIVETGAIAVAAFVVFIFLRPVEQFIYFQF
jgi:D-alanyl-lipoteichoic acid acyltransferase DltB (MBOAT superfamily)